MEESLSTADLEVVVELQKAELDRLLRENARLHDRVAQLLALQEREQVLRQQMQSLFAQRPQSPPLPLPPQPPQVEDNRAAVSAERAERRYARLKEALGHLITALERKQPGPKDDG